MSFTQRLVYALFPKRWAAAMEAESRRWSMVCPCGHETSIWDAGGVRYKAVGNPKCLYCCPQCGITVHRLEKRPPHVADDATVN